MPSMPCHGKRLEIGKKIEGQFGDDVVVDMSVSLKGKQTKTTNQTKNRMKEKIESQQNMKMSKKSSSFSIHFFILSSHSFYSLEKINICAFQLNFFPTQLDIYSHTFSSFFVCSFFCIYFCGIHNGKGMDGGTKLIDWKLINIFTVISGFIQLNNTT